MTIYMCEGERKLRGERRRNKTKQKMVRNILQKKEKEEKNVDL